MIALTFGEVRTCSGCELTQGQYIDSIKAEAKGPYLAIGLNSNDLRRIRTEIRKGNWPIPYSQDGRIEAWIMQRDEKNIRRLGPTEEFTKVEKY